MVEHMRIVMVCMTIADWLFTKRQSIMGTIANGSMNMLLFSNASIMPTITGNTEADSMQKMNLYALCTTSG